MNILKLRLLSINLFAVMCLGYATDIYAPKPLKTILTEVTGKQWTPSLINTIENRSKGGGCRTCEEKRCHKSVTRVSQQCHTSVAKASQVCGALWRLTQSNSVNRHKAI